MTDKAPPARAATTRARILDALAAGNATAKDISSLAGIPEKDVAAHLEHLAKSLKAKGGRLIVEPATCLACGFAFRDRKKLTAPGNCPECRSERVAPPSFRAETGARGEGTEDADE